MSEASPKIDVQNKVVLITGAAQGIGLAISKALLKNGARVSSAQSRLVTKKLILILCSPILLSDKHDRRR